MYGSMGEGDDGTPLQVIGGVDTGAGFFGDGMVDSTADTVVSMAYIGPNHLITCQDWFFQWAFCVTAATLFSKWIGQGEKLVKTLFQLAEAAQRRRRGGASGSPSVVAGGSGLGALGGRRRRWRPQWRPCVWQRGRL